MKWQIQIQTFLKYEYRNAWNHFYIKRKLSLGCKQNFRKFVTLKSAPPWNILFFGTDEFSLHSLKALHHEQQTRGVIGRLDVVSVSLKKIVPAVRRYCYKEGLSLQDWPVVVPHGIYDIGIVVSFGHLIPSSIIEAFPLGILNIHGSLLPRWRGAAPVIHALLNNDQETGITLMKIEPHRFDVGKIVSKIAIPIAWDTKSGALTNHLAEVGAQQLISVLHDLPRKLQTASPQSEEGITKAPKVNEGTAKIHWNHYTCSNIQARYRALDDRFPLWTLWHGTQVKLRGMVMQEEWSSHPLHEDNKAMEVKDYKESEDRVSNEIESAAKDKECSVTEIFSKSNQKGLLMNEWQTMKSTVKHRNLCEESSEKTLNHKISLGKPLPGTIVFNKKLKVLSIRCLDGWVNFCQVVIKGRKIMSAQDFYNGFVSKAPKDLQKFN